MEKRIERRERDGERGNIYFRSTATVIDWLLLTMNNLLESAADNIFITSANVLDTLTYRFSSTATNVTIPNNNDSLTAPLTEQLAKDYDTFNQVLNDYGMDLSNCVYILNSMKTKNQKEKVIKAKREQQRLEEERLRLIKEKEDMEKKEKFAKENIQKHSAQSMNGDNGLVQVDSNGNTAGNSDNNNGNNNNIDLFNMGSTPTSTTNTNGRNSGGSNNVGNDGDDMMLDLDLDNFNFDGTGADVMNFDFNDPITMDGSEKSNVQVSKNEMNTNKTSHNTQSNKTNVNANGMTNLISKSNTNLNTNSNTNANPIPIAVPNQNANLNSSTNANSATANSGTNEYLNFGQDSDLDLNLDFLQDDEMGNLMQNMAVDGGGSGSSKNENEMNDDALAADQMEQLFSQFDEMVGNGI